MRRQRFEQVGPTDGPRQRTARAGVVHEHASSSYSDFAHLLIRVVRRRRGRNRKAIRQIEGGGAGITTQARSRGGKPEQRRAARAESGCGGVGVGVGE